MQAVSYYLVLPLIYLLSISPFWLMYGVSRGLYVLFYYVVGYRKKVVINNIRNSFPHKTEKEIIQIRKDFYKYLCDLVLETLKTITWKEATVLERVSMRNVDMMNDLHEKGKSVVIVMGHLGNWEWAGPGFSLHCKHQLFVVYQPLSNKYFERLFSKSRTKFNTKIIPRKDTLRAMIRNKKTISATALIADQAPTPVKDAVWMNFLNQETAVFSGPEKISKMMDFAVVYMDVQRLKRGYYEIVPTLLSEHPKETGELEITKAFNRMLEDGILKRPETWLWSHKRWKHKRPTS